MFGTFFDKVTGLFDRRFVLGLLLPTFVFFAGAGALVATDAGWTQTISWWQYLGTSRQVTLAVATAAGLVFAATVLGTQVVAITRVFEGYWRWGWADKTIGAVGRRWQRHRLTQLANDASAMGYLREYLAFAPAELGAVLPTRLGNTLRAAESYPGDPERWGLDAVFWWPRLYLIIPDSARAQVDEARASMDQMVVLSALSVMFAAVAAGVGIAGLPLAVWAPCCVGGLALSWLTYRAAVTSAAGFGDLVPILLRPVPRRPADPSRLATPGQATGRARPLGCPWTAVVPARNELAGSGADQRSAHRLERSSAGS